MKINGIKLGEATTEAIKTELGKLESRYHGNKVEFKSTTKKEGKARVWSLPYDRIDHNGGFVGDRTTDKTEFDAFIACVSRAEHDARKQRSEGSVKTTVGGTLKKGKLSLSTRDAGLDAGKCEVGALLTDAKGLAKSIRTLRAELADREAFAKAQEEIKAKAKFDSDVLEALLGKPASAPVLTLAVA